MPRKPTMETELGRCLQCHFSSRRSSTAWRLLRSLQRGPTICQPILAVAISSGVSYLALADLMASQFAGRPPGIPAEARLADGLVRTPHIYHPSCLYHRESGSPVRRTVPAP
ncbi:hypothetical protein MTO96_035664 [Rhipicephalus appendiculatus]